MNPSQPGSIIAVIPRDKCKKNLLELESLRARAADLNSNEDSSCPKVMKIVQWSTDVNSLQVTKITSNKEKESKGHFANHTSHIKKYINIPSEKYIYVHIYVYIHSYVKWMSTGLMPCCHENGCSPVSCHLVIKMNAVLSHAILS